LNRVAPPSPFRPAEFDLRDPKNIPLAPTVPASVLDLNGNPVDAKSSMPENKVAPRDVSTTAPQMELELEPPAHQSPVAKRVSPNSLSENDTALGKIEIPNNRVPEKDSQPAGPPAVTADPAPAVSYPKTQAQPFSGPSAATTYPTTNAQPFSHPASAPQYPQTTAPPFVPPTQVQQLQVLGTQVPLAPYRLPQVFDSVPANAPTLAPPNTARGSDGGFGWGDAPGIFRRNAQPSPVLPPQPIQQAPSSIKPSFPMPFGLGSKLFGGRGDQKNPQLDFSQPNLSQPNLSQASGSQTKRSLFASSKKQVDPNTYPPQPVSHSQPNGFQTGAFPGQVPNAQFRPDLGQRAPLPTIRNPGTYDSGKAEYDFENKKREYPPFSEILATGRYFASFEAQFVRPRFNGNSGIAIVDQSGGFSATNSQVFDFDFEYTPNFRVGFESKFGPGFEVNYRTLRAGSDLQSFTSGATTSASLRASLPDSSFSSVISTTGPGQTLSGTQQLNFESIGFSIFKEVQLPITRINGLFGFQAVDIDHLVDATVVDGTGAVLQEQISRSDMRAFGPRIRLEYFRPVGHTRLEFLTQIGGSLLFGKRDQFIGGQGSNAFQRVDTDELLTTFEFLTALQIKQSIGEKRTVFGRIGYLNQAFNSGGSGFLAQDDFGLRGFTFLIGYNR